MTANTHVVQQPVGLAFPLQRSWQKPRFLPAETKLMSKKAPQATFSNELGPAHGNREAHVDDTRQPGLSVDRRSPSHGAH